MPGNNMKTRRGYDRHQSHYPYHVREDGLRQEVHSKLWPPWANPFEILDPELSEEDIKSPCIAEERCPPLLALPLEIRLIIYSMVTSGDSLPHTGVDDPYYHDFYPWDYLWLEPTYSFVALMRTCRQIQLELAPMVYRAVALNRYEGALGAIGWLQGIGSNIRHIQSVYISYQTAERGDNYPVGCDGERHGDCGAAPYAQLYRLIEQECPRLRTIHVQMSRYKLNVDTLSRRCRYAETSPPTEWDPHQAEGRANLRKLYLREVSLVLRGLARFHWLRDIHMVQDHETDGRGILAPPLMAFFLRGSLGFRLECPWDNDEYSRRRGNTISLKNPFWEPPSESGVLEWTRGPFEKTRSLATTREMDEHSVREIVQLRKAHLARQKDGEGAVVF